MNLIPSLLPPHLSGSEIQGQLCLFPAPPRLEEAGLQLVKLRPGPSGFLWECPYVHLLT